MIKKVILNLALVLASVMSVSAQAGEIRAQARFDHAYWLSIGSTCDIRWEYSGYGRRGVDRQYVSRCLGYNETVTNWSVAYPARIDQVDYPGPQNGYRLRLLVVEPLGGSNDVYVSLSTSGSFNPPPPPPGPCKPGLNCAGDNPIPPRPICKPGFNC